MRSLALFCELAMLLPVTLAQPFVGVILWSWISFMNPHQLVYGGIALAIPWALIIFICTILGCFIAREPKRFPFNAVTCLIMAFLVMISLTTVVALGPTDQVMAKYLTVFKAFLFLLVTAALTTGRERIHALVWIMALSLAYFGIKGGAFTLLTGGSSRVWGPPNTMISDNNQLAVGLLVAVPLMNYLRSESKHALIRWGFAATMVLTVFGVVGTYSRGALLALAAMSFVLWWKTSNKLLSGVVLLVLVGGAIAFMPADWVERMHTIQNYQEDASAQDRLQIWYTAWVMATSRPLTGAGFFATYTQPVVDMFTPGTGWRAVHSIWFEVLAEHGFPTFFVWVGIIIAGVVYARRVVRQATGVPGLEWCVHLAKMSQASTLAYVVGGSFLSLSYWDYYFTIVVMTSAVYEHVKATLGQPEAARNATKFGPSRLALSQSTRQA